MTIFIGNECERVS